MKDIFFSMSSMQESGSSNHSNAENSSFENIFIMPLNKPAFRIVF